jgi:hypothetical protein
MSGPSIKKVNQDFWKTNKQYTPKETTADNMGNPYRAASIGINQNFVE